VASKRLGGVVRLPVRMRCRLSRLRDVSPVHAAPALAVLAQALRDTLRRICAYQPRPNDVDRPLRIVGE
jgi:hypothetical protein